MYVHGRTDVIRTCSEEVVGFCKKMSSAGVSAEERAKALRAALDAHKKYANEVVHGRGIDRHLLGLKLIAKLNNIEQHPIFSDELYQLSTYFKLSTSNVSTC